MKVILFSIFLFSYSLAADTLADYKNYLGKYVYVSCKLGDHDKLHTEGFLEDFSDNGSTFAVYVRQTKSEKISVKNPDCLFEVFNDKNPKSFETREFNAMEIVLKNSVIRYNCLATSNITFFDSKEAYFKEVQRRSVRTTLTPSKQKVVGSSDYYHFFFDFVSHPSCIIDRLK